MSDNALQAAAMRGRQDQLHGLPPHLVAMRDTEMALIGAVINARDGIGLAQQLAIHPAEFFDLRTRVTWQAICDLAERAEPLDVISLETEIAKTGKLDAIGGVAFLGDCSAQGGASVSCDAYAANIRAAHLGRRVYETLGELLALGQRDQLDGNELLSEALARLSAIEVLAPDGGALIGTLVDRRISEIERLAQDRVEGVPLPLSGYPTGIGALDAHLGGYQPDIVTILAARPGMGKSAALLSCAFAASEAGHGVHVFSLEDSARSYAERAIVRIGNLAAERMRTGDLTRDDVSEMVRAQGEYRLRKNWLVDTRGGLSCEEVVRSVRRHKQRLGTAIVIVDYLQLVNAEARIFSTHERMGHIMTTFAEAAKADHVAYIVASQLNRKIEERADRRPVESDLRESGSIEERAKCIVGLYRGAKYTAPGTPQRGIDYSCDCRGDTCMHTPARPEWESQVQCLVLKNSNGATGTVFANWHGPRVMMW